MRRSATSLVLLILLLIAPTSSAQDRSNPDFFPFSVWYSGGKARAPMVSEITSASRSEWRRDLQQIKDLGFNTVRTWVEWARSEPRPGEYDFENLRLLFELADEVGLKVFIQMYVDSAPDWVGKIHPDTRFVTQSDYVIPPQSAPGYCTDNEEIADLVYGFYQRVAEVASEYDNFYGWDLWSEPHIINWAGFDYLTNPQFCYCHGTQARFRDWLRNKYGSLEALNEAWHRGFERWEDVEPPRFSTILTYSDYTDWKTFIQDRLARDLANRRAAVRRGGSDHVATSHAAVSSITQSPRSGSGSPDDFMMADQVDHYGTSIYPKHNRPATHWPYWRIMSIMEFQRSANVRNGGWYVGELQAGGGTIGLWLSEPVTGQDQRLWAWSAIAFGARAIHVYAYYPMSSGYESGGYGLVDLDGTPTDRARSTGEMARLVDANQDLLLRARPVPARVGIVYNRLAQLVGGPRGGGDDYHDHLVGYYRALAENNVPVEFVHRTDLEQGHLDGYDLLIVPYPLMLTRSAADGLARFVERGGRAVAEARLAWNDERGFASEILPGLGLHEVFGVREKEAWMADAVRIDVTNGDHPVFQRLEPGDRLRGAMFANTVETISPDARVLGTIDGEPAVVASRYGEGETLFVGSFVGAGTHQAAATPDAEAIASETVNTGRPSTGTYRLPAENEAFILGLVEWAGIDAPVTTTLDGRANPPLIARLHEAEGERLLFLLNYSPDDQEADVEVRLENGPYALRELVTGETRAATASDRRIRIPIQIEGRGVQVWVLEHR